MDKLYEQMRKQSAASPSQSSGKNNTLLALINMLLSSCFHLLGILESVVLFYLQEQHCIVQALQAAIVCHAELFHVIIEDLGLPHLSFCSPIIHLDNSIFFFRKKFHLISTK